MRDLVVGQGHLTSEEMEQAVAGHAGARGVAHLSGCAACARELAMFAEVRESAAVTAGRYQGMSVLTRPSARRVGGMAWGLVAAMLCVGVMAPVAMRHRAVAPVVAVRVGDVGPQMSDDALLTSVQDDLSTSVPESLLPLAGSGGSSTAVLTGTQRTAK